MTYYYLTGPLTKQSLARVQVEQMSVVFVCEEEGPACSLSDTKSTPLQ